MSDEKRSHLTLLSRQCHVHSALWLRALCWLCLFCLSPG